MIRKNVLNISTEKTGIEAIIKATNRCNPNQIVRKLTTIWNFFIVRYDISRIGIEIKRILDKIDKTKLSVISDKPSINKIKNIIYNIKLTLFIPYKFKKT